MARTSAPLAFPTWRDLWASLEGMPALLARADAVLRRRMAGNHRIPRLDTHDHGPTLALAIRALRAWANGEPPARAAARPEIARQIHAVAQPVLRAAAWPRWLFLERAFFDGSATGDLLFAALALRTMCEEVQRLHALELDADELASLAASDATTDRERLNLHLSVAWTSLDVLPEEMVLYGVNWPSLKLMAKILPDIKSARTDLNSYVHPNYGSHIAALFPERTAAAGLLLKAVVAVYEAFFALSWTEYSLARDSVPTGIGSLESWPRTVRRFRSHTLPEVRRTARDPATTEVMKVPALLDWLTKERADAEAMLRDPAAADLFRDLPRQAICGATNGESAGYRMWEGARAMDVFNLVCARRAEKLLTDEFPSGAPDATDQVRWLRFNALALQLAMLLDQVKAAAFKTQLLRQITQGNSLGVLLCVRSLIEHRALAVWLPQEVGGSLKALAGQLRAANPLPPDAAEVEKPLAKFLAVHAKATNEDRRSWIMQESGGVRTASLKLGQVVEAAFSEHDRFRTLYAFASAAMHGRGARGIDLALNAAKVRKQARLVGLLTLERVCSRDEEMDHLSDALAHFVQLDHAASFGGTPAAATDVMAQQAFGRIEGALVPGVDYTGEGTPESPFRFSPHVQFHRGSYALLEQLGVDLGSCPRVLEHDVAGHLCDRWQAPDRDYWFQVRFIELE